MTQSPSSAGQTSDAIVIAGCDSLADSLAMSRWLNSELSQWPRGSWQFWITDASDCAAVRAARIEDPAHDPQWRVVTPKAMAPGHVVCRIMGGRCGLVILATEDAAAAAMRGLAGLVSGLTCFPANDPVAAPLRKSFASFGATAGS